MNDNIMEAVRRVTVELANILADYWPHTAIIGGLAAYLLIPQDEKIPKHRGTSDIDLLIDHERIDEGTYLSIREILMHNLYQEDKRKPFRYYRTLSINDNYITVPVDFLAGEHGGTDVNSSFQEIDDILALKTHGSDFTFTCIENKEITSEHPDGGIDTVIVHIASAPAIILLKGLALNRMEDKDAYDICYLILSYPEGIKRLAERFEPLLEFQSGKEAFANIRDKFSSRDSIGVKKAADEYLRVYGGDIEIYRTMAYEALHQLVDFIVNK